jgi:hypothetical protein
MNGTIAIKNDEATMSPNCCFLHIGTHRTGTTSLQTFLTVNEQSLQRNGIYVPKTGRPWPNAGHHNVAWELNDDPRFKPAYGTLSQLLEELHLLRPPVACVTSEDFEYLHERRDSLYRLFSGMPSSNYDVRIIAYFRPQVDYLESLYAELVKHGLCTDFRTYVDEIVEHGRFVTFGVLRYAFDYLHILEPFSGIFGRDHVVARRYPFDRQPNHLILDLFAIVSATFTANDLDYVCGTRHNASYNFIGVVQLLLKNVRKKHRQQARRPSRQYEVWPRSGPGVPFYMDALILFI